MLFDSHAHLDYEYECTIEELLAEAKAHGVDRIVSIAAAPDSLDRVVEIAERFANVYHTSGIHPHDAQHWGPEIAAHVERNARKTKCVAVGELGLDFHYNLSDKAQQFRALEAQMALSVTIAKPIVFHSREADQDTVDFLTQHSKNWYAAGHKNPPGVLHCFTGTKLLAEQCLALGYFLSFSGIITFKNAQDLRDVVRDIAPLDRLLVETDSPYLAPIPFRGKKNHPAYTKFVAEKVAELKGMSLADLAVLTTRNTEKLFNLSSS
jgi:TatD DNase family protein